MFTIDMLCGFHMPSNWTKPLLLPLGVLILCLTGNSASGSCGDYLHTRFGRPTMTDHDAKASNQSVNAGDAFVFQPSTRHSASGKPERSMLQLTENRLPARPCSGPGCRSGRNQLPDPAAPFTVESTAPAKALHSTDSLNGSQTITSESPRQKHAHLQDGHLSRIDRPPQPIA